MSYGKQDGRRFMKETVRDLRLMVGTRKAARIMSRVVHRLRSMSKDTIMTEEEMERIITEETQNVIGD